MIMIMIIIITTITKIITIPLQHHHWRLVISYYLHFGLPVHIPISK